MKITKLVAQEEFPNVVFLGDLYWIEQGARKQDREGKPRRR